VVTASATVGTATMPSASVNVVARRRGLLRMRDGDSRHRMLRGNPFGDLTQLRLGARMRLVVEPIDRTVVVVVPHAADEHDEAAGRRIPHGVDHFVHGQRCVAQPREPHE